MSYLTVRTRVDGTVAVVSVDGYLNSLLGEELERVALELLNAGGNRIVLNFEGTRLINSIGISCVIGVVERSAERGEPIGFCSLSRINRELFQMTGVARHVQIFDTEEEAVAFFRDQG